MKLTEHFSKWEFDSKDGAPMPTSVLENVKKVAQNLEVIRSYFGGKPIKINSGYRSPSHNASPSVKGKPNSQHLYGRAADIKISGVTPLELYTGILYLIAEGKISQGGLGLYNTFVHYDIRGHRARWNPSGKNISGLEAEIIASVKKKRQF